MLPVLLSNAIPMQRRETVPRSNSDEINEEDSMLLSLIAGGDREAFDRLYRRYFKRVYPFIYRVTQKREVIEEVLNDTMLTVWQKAGSFAGRSRVSTWVFGIAYHKALKAATRGRPQAYLDDLDPEDLPDQGQKDPIESLALKDQIARALTGLSAEQRAVVELTYYHGYSYQEIAQIVDCPLGTVKTRMRSARSKLRAILTGLDAGPAPKVGEEGDGSHDDRQ